MDTEFPGTVYTPGGTYANNQEYQYQNVKCNVDVLKIIQLGLTFMDEHGNLPEPVSTWQFNFKFDLQTDLYAPNSIDLLIRSGIQFDRHEAEGIDINQFAELMTTSGIVLSDTVRWLTFHSMYDFAYLLRILTALPLPDDANEFYEMLRLFFAKFYDIKWLMQACKNLRGGLQELADQLEIKRIGPQHQAGSDSRLTGATFFKIKELYFDDCINETTYSGFLFGLYPTNNVNNSNTNTEQNTQNCNSPLPKEKEKPQPANAPTTVS